MGVYEELVQRGLLAQVTDEEEIRKMVNAGQATFYIGFDPTADSLHVGHFMALCLMKRLQEAGNHPIALVGGGTGMIGDPSGRTDMRMLMGVEQIDHNCACFKKQMERFIEFGEGKARMVNNADWLRDLNFLSFMREIGTHFNVNEMLRARCYVNRMEKGLSFFEFSYMLMQAYDFYMLYQNYGCNMEFGGDDQWSNMLAGTELIRKKLQKDAYALTITLLTNKEGNKMGKTANGAVWLDPNKTSPYEFYQYWRNVDDADVMKCIKLLTFIPLEEIYEMENWEGEELNKAKKLLAYHLTELVHGSEEAKKAEKSATGLFAGGGFDENMPTIYLDELDNLDNTVGGGSGRKDNAKDDGAKSDGAKSGGAEDAKEGSSKGAKNGAMEGKDTKDTIDILSVLVLSGLCQSRGDARRNVQQGGVSVDGQKETDPKREFKLSDFKEGIIFRRGKKNFVRVMYGSSD